MWFRRDARIEMERKTRILCFLLFSLGGIYFYQFTDWFSKKTIQASVSFRPARQVDEGTPLPVVLGFDQDLHLNELSVFELDLAATNQPKRQIWKLESSKGSEPIRGFLYGSIPAGMREVKPPGSAPRLKPGGAYRVEMRTGRVKGAVEFVARGSE